MSRPHSAYQTTQLSGMSPGKVVEAILDGALRAITRAIVAAEQGDVAVRGAQVSKALALVGELQSALDLETGALAEDLYRLYDYVQTELLQGNMKGDAARFGNAETVMAEIYEGWVAMMEATENATTTASTAATPPPAGEARISDYA